MSPTENTSDRDIVIQRTFDATCELVWKALTSPEHVVHWWGPTGFTTTIEKMDLRVGGVWKHVMHGPDGTDYPNKSIFTEVSPPNRLGYKHTGGDGEHKGANFHSTISIEDIGNGKTQVTLHSVFATPECRDYVVETYGAIEGGKQTLARLGEYMKSMDG